MKGAQRRKGPPPDNSSSEDESGEEETVGGKSGESRTSQTISCSSSGPSTYGSTTLNESGYDSDAGFYAKLRKMENQRRSEDTASIFSIFIALLMLGLIFATVVWPGHFNAITVQKDKEDLFLHYQENKVIYLIGLLSSVGVALGLGLTCCCFSSVITYFDSLEPGFVPPTPASPTPIKEVSGHSFHMSYTMALINGAVVFAYTLWYNKENFWLL